MANPRKFSEKIALHNQKQAEETAAFERIMQEVSVTRVIQGPGIHHQQVGLPRHHLSPHSQPFLRPYLGGSLPNVNQIASPPMADFSGRMGGFDDPKQSMRHFGRFDTRMRPYLPRRPGMDPSRNKPLENVPAYGMGPYLSPPGDSNWRSFALSRTNSDSALHQSARNPNSAQEPFNSPHFTAGQQNNHQHNRRDFQDNSHRLGGQMKQLLDFRPKSCDGPKINILPEGVLDMSASHRNMSSPPSMHRPPNPSLASVSHVTQIGNNTGSLPDLTNLHMPSPLTTPIDYEGEQQVQGTSHNPLLYGARSTGNLPAASAINPHISSPGMTPRGVASSNQNRPRRHTHNGPGPSPLSLSSPNHRRMKFPGMKSELKSPTGAGPYYNYPYPTQHTNPEGRMWSDPNNGSPIHNNMSSRLGKQTMPPPSSHAQMLSNTNPLRVDVNAATNFAAHHNIPHHRNHRQSSSGTGGLSSPVTSPTSPASQHSSQSPAQSPQHLPELTSSCNPALSEAYYRTEFPLQPLQRQFEHFNMMNDVSTATTTNSIHRYVQSHANSQSNVGNYHNRALLSPNRIPDIVFTDVDQSQSSDNPGGVLSMMENPNHLPEYANDYFPGDEFKVSLGLEELEMLGQNNIEDPVMEDSLHLDSL